MKSNPPDPYATLGLDPDCTDAQIRSAYRLLAKQHHPDLNPGSADAIARTQALNAAHEILGNPERRRAHDDALAAAAKSAAPHRPGTRAVNIAKDVQLGVREFLRGAALDVVVNDPANPNGPEHYRLVVPPLAAPNARFRIPRNPPFDRGFVVVRAKVRPDYQFKARGSDLRCDLKISPQRATQGGTESVRGAAGDYLRVPIPPNVARGAVVRIAGEGLPKANGGRGDLLVRIVYRPEVRITRSKTHP